MTPATRRRLRKAAFWAAFVVLLLLLVAVTNPARSQVGTTLHLPLECLPAALGKTVLEGQLGLAKSRDWLSANGLLLELWESTDGGWAITVVVADEARKGWRCLVGRDGGEPS